MKKVITYGTYDLLHYGHINLLKRAKELGDYLIVGVTADDFDKARGKINVQQSLMERIEAVKATGLADEIIVEEYEGQKIDDIHRYNVDIFTVGSDWEGKFDYLKEYCEVVYLKRTEGISSTQLRDEQAFIKLGFIGDIAMYKKYAKEIEFVNGIQFTAVYFNEKKDQHVKSCSSFEELLKYCDAVLIESTPQKHAEQIELALNNNKHVICESPIALSAKEAKELYRLSKEKGLVLMEAIKTAYSTAYNRLLLMVKSGKIGQVVSVDAVCTSQKELDQVKNDYSKLSWNSICGWGPTALLPIFQIYGSDPIDVQIISMFLDKEKKFDSFTRINIIYPKGTASIKVGKGVKSEGDLVITGTKGYIYVPAPWWKLDYFEIRYERIEDNKRFFYQLDGEGIRYELLSFVQMIQNCKKNNYISEECSVGIAQIMEQFFKSQLMVLSNEK